MSINRIVKRTITKQALKFIIVGLISTAINYGVFFGLYATGTMGYIYASGVGYLSGMLFGFYYNRKYTFYSREGVRKSLPIYLGVYLTSLLLSLILLRLFVEGFNTNVLITNLCMIFLTTVTNFLGVKVFAFRNKEW